MNAKSPPLDPWPSKAPPMTWTEANEESCYIHRIDPMNPGKAFDDDPKCFASYCRMQANSAMRSGHEYQALEMEAAGRKALDNCAQERDIKVLRERVKKLDGWLDEHESMLAKSRREKNAADRRRTAR